MKIPITNKLFELLYDDHSVQKQCDNIAYTGGGGASRLRSPTDISDPITHIYQWGALDRTIKEIYTDLHEIRPI